MLSSLLGTHLPVELALRDIMIIVLCQHVSHINDRDS